MVLVRKPVCDRSVSLSHSLCTTQTIINSLGGEKVQLSDALTRAVAQDNEVACCHSVAHYEPENPRETPTLRKLQPVSMCYGDCSAIFRSATWGKRPMTYLLSTNTARRRKGRAKKQKTKQDFHHSGCSHQPHPANLL